MPASVDVCPLVASEHKNVAVETGRENTKQRVLPALAAKRGYRGAREREPPGAQSLRYVRVHDGNDGERHFEDVDVELEFAPFAPPAAPIAVSDSLPASAVVFFGGPENWFGDFHPTPHRQFCMICAGQVELQTTDGETRRFSPGDLLLLDDLSGRGHISRVVGPNPLAGVFVQLPHSRNSY